MSLQDGGRRGGNHIRVLTVRLQVMMKERLSSSRKRFPAGQMLLLLPISSVKPGYLQCLMEGASGISTKKVAAGLASTIARGLKVSKHSAPIIEPRCSN